MPDDIVFFDRNGSEVHRIESNTVFQTWVMHKNADNHIMDTEHYSNKAGWVNVAMPNLINSRPNSDNGKMEDVSGAQFQAMDYQIAASTYLANEELRSGNMTVSDAGGNIIPASSLKDVPSISPTLVKAWAMQESHAGVDGSLLAVNNNGDFSASKKAIGMSKGTTYSANQEINFGIRLALGKGFNVVGASYSNQGKTVTRTYLWTSWSTALGRYNGNGTAGYGNSINTMVDESQPR